MDGESQLSRRCACKTFLMKQQTDNAGTQQHADITSRFSWIFHPIVNFFKAISKMADLYAFFHDTPTKMHMQRCFAARASGHKKGSCSVGVPVKNDAMFYVELLYPLCFCSRELPEALHTSPHIDHIAIKVLTSFLSQDSEVRYLVLVTLDVSSSQMLGLPQHKAPIFSLREQMPIYGLK